jgi:anti-sigma B factor antagonist
MSSDPFRLKSEPGAQPGVQVLTLKGPFTSATAPTFLEAVLKSVAPKLIIEMSETPYLDSSAIGVLVRAYVSCQKAGRKIAFVGMNQRVTSVLRITGVEPLFDTYATLGEAEAALA